MNKYEKFKHLLEYFVAHLEWCVNGEDSQGFDVYIKPLKDKDKFCATGQGYNGNSIQNQINDWCDFENGKICINVQSKFNHGYKTKACYLNWLHTAININSIWEKDSITALIIRNNNETDIEKKLISELGLFDNSTPNDDLKSFFDRFEAIIVEWNNNKIRQAAMKKIQPYVELLQQVHNLILTGAPGTGKTFLAKQIAKQIIGVQTDEELEKSGQFAFVQFHPSYDYTDFVEGLRPTQPDGNGNIGFELKKGIFKAFCRKAMDISYKTDDFKPISTKEEKRFVFVIDEINRGEISKIFGELFFSIDPSYRGKKGAVKTQYSNMHNDEDKVLYVPENVYIIGSMNDIDRSVESFDFAMRRRFAWEEITAEQSADNMNLPEIIKNKMAKLNEEITKIEGLNAAYHIGGAYFLNALGEARTDYESIWKHRIAPLLKEYLRGIPDESDKLEILKNAYSA